MNFRRLLENEINAVVGEAREAVAEDLVVHLQILLRSPRAAESVKRITEALRARGAVGSDGEPLAIGDPAELADRVVVRDGQVFFTVSDDEDRWLRADQLMGLDLLSELGIKYTST